MSWLRKGGFTRSSPGYFIKVWGEPKWIRYLGQGGLPQQSNLPRLENTLALAQALIRRLVTRNSASV
ncbi:uncharacterized protein N7518_008425 [Penicillium psychrosexuale]|uniref:uncharacterized protein n=1 Tax=Penicillium psychrosexuale TaxID=1002107 RepID=UPI0025456CD3|nr:uncharacterized protein N7518_008425 [Penicillium psychrosexuale]KAJ5791414.1 hypothetical protein N7518_008425 [Penicillium psychrosexuale]